jgi:hypothetical protein
VQRAQVDWVDGDDSVENRRAGSAAVLLSVPSVVLAEPTSSMNLGVLPYFITVSSTSLLSPVLH